MVIENFKSYGGVKEIGPFHKSFSSVVGPNGGDSGAALHSSLQYSLTARSLIADARVPRLHNAGSGKSNVIDAMLFVFGKKASQMRFNKLSELIHRSAEYPDLGYARVSVFFQEIMDDTCALRADGSGCSSAGQRILALADRNAVLCLLADLLCSIGGRLHRRTRQSGRRHAHRLPQQFEHVLHQREEEVSPCTCFYTVPASLFNYSNGMALPPYSLPSAAVP